MKTLIHIVISLFIVWFIVGIVFNYQTKTYVRGKYGEHCYTVANKDPHITKPIYFRSLQDCLNTL